MEALIKSLNLPDPQVEKTLMIEAEKGLETYKVGKLKTILFEEMFKKMMYEGYNC